MKTLLKAPNGNDSSKRIAGLFLILLCAIEHVAFGIAKVELDYQEWLTLLITGGTLLGLGLADHFAHAIKKPSNEQNANNK